MHTPNLCDARLRTNHKVDIKKDLYGLSDNQKRIGLNQKYYVKTYGCQMNEHDSENIKAILEEMAYTETNDMNEADLIILNTCAIRENAHNKVFGMAGRIKHLKESKHVKRLTWSDTNKLKMIVDLMGVNRFLLVNIETYAFIPWSANAEDCLAEDWIIVK